MPPTPPCHLQEPHTPSIPSQTRAQQPQLPPSRSRHALPTREPNTGFSRLSYAVADTPSDLPCLSARVYGWPRLSPPTACLSLCQCQCQRVSVDIPRNRLRQASHNPAPTLFLSFSFSTPHFPLSRPPTCIHIPFNNINEHRDTSRVTREQKKIPSERISCSRVTVCCVRQGFPNSGDDETALKCPSARIRKGVQRGKRDVIMIARCGMSGSWKLE
ncbi:hypothetical protein CPB84DRAFT_196588 [Gymnopilus junonius]|uniref:Uncharacterized protein n=1 Tax=Gymnopilus junonius TaxID=109634 RepID=A0A9P5ND08_GYMJU|nr:hypothetical protein CPB84DRAFT_196588 [Gymnopilus junonius]